MQNELSPKRELTDRELARLYRLQVRDLEDYAMFAITPEGVIVSWNRAIEITFGYTEQEWIGLHGSVVFTDEDRAAGIPEAEMRNAAEAGTTSDVRWHRRKDGTSVYMTGVLRALRDEDGRLLGFSKLFYDDTRRKQVEDALTQSNADLQEFAYIASHDLQQPLRTITNFAQLLERKYGSQLGEDGDEMIRTIVDSAARMSALVTDLLSYSQLGREERNSVSVSLDEDVESAISLLHTSLEESGAVVTHDPLPEVHADRSQLLRLFQNLISNAIKFRKADVPPKVHIWAERHDSEWIIRVRDNGIGFPPEYSQSIFTPFKRLHGSEYAGSGIGLAACRRIVEGFGGHIGADSQVGKGSTFWFTIPAV